MIVTTKHGRRESVHTLEDQRRVLERVMGELTPLEAELIMAVAEQGEDEMQRHEQLYVEHRYHTQPVSMEQFIEDPYFLGDSCETLWPKLKQDVIDLFASPYREAILTGGIGVGKTFCASIAICRIIYELSCLVNPQKTFGLSSGTEIVIPLISKNLILAREVMKSAIDDKIKDSPYFQNHCAPNIKREYTLFPNNIRVTIGSYGSERILGANVICAFCDETNFPPKTRKQQITTGFGQRVSAAHFDIVEKVYRGLVRRIKSRFQKIGGDFPGMVLLASSAATVDSFTERKIRESKDDPSIFVRDHTPWTARPEIFTGEWFYILCSASSLKARFINPEEYNKIDDAYLKEHDAWIIEVPDVYRTDFETDMENALRDIAGISTQAISAFIQRLDAVDDCIDDRKHPFDAYEWIAGGPGAFDWKALCLQYERTLPGGHKETAWAPRIKRTAYRWCHIDTSISGDSSGICVGHVDRWVEVVRRDGDGNRYTDIAPFYVIDFMMRINPPPAEQIYMPDLRRLVYELAEHGFVFSGFSSDTYQYIEMHQQIRRRGITPHIISLDSSTDAYNELKSAIYENRIRFYDYAPFIDELKALEYDRLRGKVDHQQAGSKDVADAVAGVVYGLFNNAERLPLEAMRDGPEKMTHEFNWVTEGIPASKVDMGAVRSAKQGDEDEGELFPILIGSDD